MIGNIIIGHGAMASGFKQSCLQIIGDYPNMIFIDFPEESSTEILDQQILAAIAELKSTNSCEKGILFLTDLLGGTPFNRASILSKDLQQSDVIAGTNLSMLFSCALALGDEDFKSYVENVKQAGISSITTLSASTKKTATIDDEGI